MLRAGRYTSRARIERQATGTATAGGNVLQSWATVGSPFWCAIRPEFGRESVEAGRLETSSRATVTLRRSAFSEGITAADRLVVTGGPQRGLTYNIRSIVQTMDNAEIEFVCEAGGIAQ
jgi:head-tail adaptor